MSHKQHHCPGCDQQKFMKLKDGVCNDCHNLIRESTRRAEEMNDKTKVGTALYVLPGASSDLPYIPHDVDSFGDPNKPRLSELFYRLALEVSEPCVDAAYDNDRADVFDFLGHNKRSYYRSGQVRIMSPTVRDLMNTTLQTMIGQLNEAHEKGKERGRSFLMDLANGDLSLNAFEKK